MRLSKKERNKKPTWRRTFFLLIKGCSACGNEHWLEKGWVAHCDSSYYGYNVYVCTRCHPLRPSFGTCISDPNLPKWDGYRKGPPDLGLPGF